MADFLFRLLQFVGLIVMTVGIYEVGTAILPTWMCWTAAIIALLIFTGWESRAE